MDEIVKKEFDELRKMVKKKKEEMLEALRDKAKEIASGQMLQKD